MVTKKYTKTRMEYDFIIIENIKMMTIKQNYNWRFLRV